MSDDALPVRQYAIEVSQDGSLLHSDLLPLFLQRFDREQTRRAYRNDIVQFFCADVITVHDVNAVTFLDINNYIANFEDTGAKPATIKRRIAALRGFFDWLLALEVIKRNPVNRQLTRRVRAARRSDRTIIFLSSEEAGRLVDATSEMLGATIRDRALILTLLHCALRRSEAAAMDVDHVRPLGHHWVLDLPATKGGSDQYVKIPSHVVDEIETMKAHYGIESGPLWRSLSNRGRGKRLTTHSIYRIVNQTAMRAGIINRVGAHTLRHTGCTLAIEAGASIQQVQTHARHKNLETTMMYVHQRDKLRDSAADYIRIKR